MKTEQNNGITTSSEENRGFIDCDECKREIGVNEEYLSISKHLEQLCDDATIQVNHAVFEFALCSNCKDKFIGIKIILKKTN